MHGHSWKQDVDLYRRWGGGEREAFGALKGRRTEEGIGFLGLKALSPVRRTLHVLDPSPRRAPPSHPKGTCGVFGVREMFSNTAAIQGLRAGDVPCSTGPLAVPEGGLLGRGHLSYPVLGASRLKPQDAGQDAAAKPPGPHQVPPLGCALLG